MLKSSGTGDSSVVAQCIECGKSEILEIDWIFQAKEIVSITPMVMVMHRLISYMMSKIISKNFERGFLLCGHKKKTDQLIEETPQKNIFCEKTRKHVMRCSFRFVFFPQRANRRVKHQTGNRVHFAFSDPFRWISPEGKGVKKRERV